MSESSSGTIKFSIVLSTDSSSAVSAEVNGEDCTSPNNKCTIDLLFQSLITAGGPPLPQGAYTIDATYRSGHSESPPVTASSITHTIDRTGPTLNDDAPADIRKQFDEEGDASALPCAGR